MDIANLKSKERAIQEKRSIEAIRKNLMGLNGKLGIIVRHLGQPIIHQGSGICDITYLEDYYDNDEEETMPTMDNDIAIYNEGFHFNGLSRGQHFEITYTIYDSHLKATFQGYLVYEEYAGDLFAYVPNTEWEDDIVEPLYKEATFKAKENANSEPDPSILSRLTSVIDNIRERWGL